MKQQSTLSDHSSFECFPAAIQDLERLRELYTDFFGSDVPELSTMQSWHGRNPEIFYLLHRVTRPRPGHEKKDLVGSFKACPVDQTCVALLEREAVSGTTLPVDSIVDINEAAALYVGDVAAKDKIARGWLVYHLDDYFEIAKNLGLPIYARPLKSDGLRLMKQYGFRPVSNLSPGESPFGRIFKLLPQQASTRRPSRGKRIRALPK
jgi:hypothetical protein